MHFYSVAVLEGGAEGSEEINGKGGWLRLFIRKAAKGLISGCQKEGVSLGKSDKGGFWCIPWESTNTFILLLPSIINS